MNAVGYSNDYSSFNGTASRPDDFDAVFIVGQKTFTVECPNCGVVRHLDADGYVEKCKNCDDDEWNIWEVGGKP